ncbi:MAG: hypothetical protein A2591_03775 [Candidatus Yonathbacteria bacterium RIFOXYD1_FULL_52_36]|uniref:Bacterial Ig-like domain-containing protein n=1 Tax=Candidatus Yonathbacteria bacterium RIFOXYD1_FULL_52_36 TaxID=1802730 RepID=A0A1G2SLB9_9BACT|nr:MAG: hypothetical protein A2591_03775 [Candidatus Yonathbacteria bacterium RIFOXYD1_FULL_52_36]
MKQKTLMAGAVLALLLGGAGVVWAQGTRTVPGSTSLGAPEDPVENQEQKALDETIRAIATTTLSSTTTESDIELAPTPTTTETLTVATQVDRAEVQAKVEYVSTRTAEQAVLDTDTDGISDADETNLYGTDPNNADTDGDGTSDRNEYMSGRDPLRAEATARIRFEDPRATGEVRTDIVVVSQVSSRTVTEEVTTATTTPTASRTEIVVRGKASPHALVTLYVFSVPTVVVVQADSEGNWQYAFSKELEDGNHTVYAAVADTSGTIVAKSQEVGFVKQAAALTVEGTLPALTAMQGPGSTSLVGSPYMMALALLLGVLLAGALVIFGQKYWRPVEVLVVKEGDTPTNNTDTTPRV